MHHRIVFVKKIATTSYEKFHLDWQMVHAPLLMGTVNLKGYVQNRPVAAQWGRGLYDGIAELYYDSAALEQEAFDSHQSKIIREHEHSFMVEEETFSALVDEQVELEGRQTANRVFIFDGDEKRIPEGLAVRVSRLHLDDAETHTGARSILSVWTASEPDAFKVKDALGGESENIESLVVTPTPIVTPPIAPYIA
ncbi:EthD family reductase [Corynebacterium lubricantis]|uniref:EthD family reductase n=1 Tax=Corynebacterium lubricantis TaxID=541095 RepID=UPI000374FB34|nr:EthD family reductase [Corynebacterium lubricantis]